ncbi:MAG: hypothetical protein IBX50_12165 [Marinospirillum sp.]|uniref:hypothetical protein n=1 Tax=Marinospirillum sp. TaxID=2183934 RepID=UPI0019D99ED2|nr:hypothetical protein [Marinospirillum sp.]MBE0507451.1 hypothetical protein [Marinospirillum sp.]
MPAPLVFAAVAGMTTTGTAATAAAGTAVTGMAKIKYALETAQTAFKGVTEIMDQCSKIKDSIFGPQMADKAKEIGAMQGTPAIEEHAAKAPGFSGALVEIVMGRGRSSEPGMDQSGPSIGG